MNVIIPLYSIIYLLNHLGLLLYNQNRSKICFRWISVIYRFWLLFLDIIIIGLVPFKNDWYQLNIYPIWLIFSIVFYYIIRHCLRNINSYQYLVHLIIQKRIYTCLDTILMELLIV